MRFYDPAIFRKYIEQKDPNIIYALFDGIEHYWCEDEEDANILIQYSQEKGKLLQTALALTKDNHEN